MGLADAELDRAQLPSQACARFCRIAGPLDRAEALSRRCEGIARAVLASFPASRRIAHQSGAISDGLTGKSAAFPAGVPVRFKIQA
jgi:hypothetical protein